MCHARQTALLRDASSLRQRLPVRKAHHVTFTGQRDILACRLHQNAKHCVDYVVSLFLFEKFETEHLCRDSLSRGPLLLGTKSRLVPSQHKQTCCHACRGSRTCAEHKEHDVWVSSHRTSGVSEALHCSRERASLRH